MGGTYRLIYRELPGAPRNLEQAIVSNRQSLNFDLDFRKGKNMVRTTFEPTAEQKRQVQVLSAHSIRQEDIATEVGLRSPKTPRKLPEDSGRCALSAPPLPAAPSFVIDTMRRLNGDHP